MKPYIRVTIYFLLFLIAGCKKENDTNINQPPVADAGADQVILLPADSIELKGSGTDSDGSIESFRWSKVVGPASFDILNPNEAVTKVKNLTEGVYEIVLIITDNDGATSNDFVTITVLPKKPPTYHNYRSKQTGFWHDSLSWEHFDGSHWINASRPPFNMDGEIIILDGHTITISTPVEVDQLLINEGGGLVLKSDFYIAARYPTTNDYFGLTNNGILEWQDGLLSLFGGYYLGLINNGNFIISGNDTLQSYEWDSDVRIINNGTITKTSLGITNFEVLRVIDNTSTSIIQGVGTLSVNGGIAWLPDAFSKNGSIDPGLPIGVLKIKNVQHPFSSGSSLKIEIKDNSGPGTGHDQLQFDKEITLNGTLTIREIGTAISNGKFTVLTSSEKIEGNFKNMNLPPGYSVQINNNSVDLLKN